MNYPAAMTGNRNNPETNMRRGFHALLCLWLAIFAHAATADQSFDPGKRIKTATDLQSATCVALQADGAVVVLSRRELDEFARRIPAEWKTEEERMALIHGTRAQLLLNELSGSKGANGCHDLSRGLKEDALYLVARLLEEGRAGVLSPTGKALNEITMRQVSKACGPQCVSWWVEFYVPYATVPFLSLMTAIT
ncbi:MAG: hypothetical protein QM776_14960 [Rhodocyclaceae bacterium]